MPLTNSLDKDKIYPVSTKSRPSVIEQLLGPLKEGNSVFLLVEDPKLPWKKRKYKPVLILAPGKALGRPGPWLLAAMPPYGSEMIDLSVDIKVGDFIRLGLRAALARSLVDALNKVLWR